MTTPAQRAGIVPNRHYKVTAEPGSQKHYNGGVYKLSRDDGTTLPYFDLVSSSTGKHDKRACIYVDGTNGTKLVPVEELESPDYSVVVAGGRTVITIQKALTVEEVKVALQAAGL